MLVDRKSAGLRTVLCGKGWAWRLFGCGGGMRQTRVQDSISLHLFQSLLRTSMHVVFEQQLGVRSCERRNRFEGKLGG